MEMNLLMSSLSDLRKHFNQRKIIKNLKSRSPSPSIGRPPSHTSAPSALSYRQSIRPTSAASSTGELTLPQNRSQLLQHFRKSASMSSPRRLVSPIPLTYRQSAAALLCDRISKYYYKHLSRWKSFVQSSKVAEQDMTSFKRASQIRISVNSKSPNRAVHMPKSSSRLTESAAVPRKPEAWREISFRNDTHPRVSNDSNEIAGIFQELKKRSKVLDFELKNDPETPRHMKYFSPLKDLSPPIKNISRISKASDFKPTAADDEWSEMSPEATVSFLQDSLRGAGISCLASALASLSRQRLMAGFHCVYIKYTRSVAASAQLSYLVKVQSRALRDGFAAIKRYDASKSHGVIKSLLRLKAEGMPRQLKPNNFPSGFRSLARMFKTQMKAAWTQLLLHRKLLKMPGLIMPTKAKSRYASVAYSIDGPVVMQTNKQQARLKNCLDISTRQASIAKRECLSRWRSSKSFDMPRSIDPPKLKPIPKKTNQANQLVQALARFRIVYISRLQTRLFSKLKQQGSTSQLRVKALQLLLKNLDKDAKFRQRAAFDQWRLTVRQDETDVLRAIAMAQMLAQLRQVRKLCFIQCLQAASRKVKKAVDIREMFKLSSRLQARKLSHALLTWKTSNVNKPSNVRGGVALMGTLRVLLRKQIDPLFRRQGSHELVAWASRLQTTSCSKMAATCRKLSKAYRVLKSFVRLSSSNFRFSKLQALSAWRSTKARPRRPKATYLSFILNSLTTNTKAQAWQRLKYFAVKQSYNIRTRQQAVKSFVAACNNSLSKTTSFSLQLWLLRSKEEQHLECLEVVLTSWVKKRVQKGVVRSWSKGVVKMKRVTRGLELIGKLYRWRLDDYFQTFSYAQILNFSDSPLRTPPRMSISRQSEVIALLTIHTFVGKQAQASLMTALQLWRKGIKPKPRRFSNKAVLATITKLTRLSEFVKIKRKELMYWAYSQINMPRRRLNKRQLLLMKSSVLNWNSQVSTNSRRVLECFRLWKRICQQSV